MIIPCSSTSIIFLNVFITRCIQSFAVQDYEILIGGMGAAGMSASYTLEKEGNIKNYAMLEGKDHIGGKINAVKFGFDKSLSIETGAGYISGGVDNPFYCQMKKMKDPKYRGFNVKWTMQVNNLEGKEVLGDWETDWAYDWDNYPVPKNAAQRFIRAHGEALWFGPNCLFPDAYAELNERKKKWCNALCSVNLTEMTKSDGGILDLVETDRNICNNTGVFTSSDDIDMSVTDLMRVDGFFAKDDPDGTCVARAVEYIYHDKEIATTPWSTSAKDWFYAYGVVFDSENPDFGKEKDYYVSDPRNYIYLLKSKLADVLSTSKNTPEEIIIDDDRLFLNSKITSVKWDPEGVEDVVITYCKTTKENEFSFPCADSERFELRAAEFISTFTVGILKKTMELERMDSYPPIIFDDIAPKFDPPLSSIDNLAKTLDQREMGTLTKLFMQFSCNFWGDKETYLLPYNEDGYQCDFIPLAYSLDAKDGLKGSNILALAVAGPRAEELSKTLSSSANSTDEVYKQVLPLLNNHFKDGIQSNCGVNELTADNILDLFTTDWFNDPQSRGCWLTAPLGAKYEDEFDFSGIGNLYFSGEATCERHSGWVPGGWFSGERTTKILLKERKPGFEDIDTRTLCDVGKDEMNFNKNTCEWKPISAEENKLTKDKKKKKKEKKNKNKKNGKNKKKKDKKKQIKM